MEQENTNLKHNNIKVFVKRKDSHMNIGDDESFFCIDKDEMIMYRVGLHDVIDQRINLETEEFTSEYISLEELLNQCTYTGKHKSNPFGEKIFIAYETEDYQIYHDNKSNNVLDIRVNPFFTLKDIESEEEYPELQDKKQVYELIVNQNIKRIEEYKQQSILFNSGLISPLEGLYGNHRQGR